MPQSKLAPKQALILIVFFSWAAFVGDARRGSRVPANQPAVISGSTGCVRPQRGRTEIALDLLRGDQEPPPKSRTPLRTLDGRSCISSTTSSQAFWNANTRQRSTRFFLLGQHTHSGRKSWRHEGACPTFAALAALFPSYPLGPFLKDELALDPRCPCGPSQGALSSYQMAPWTPGFRLIETRAQFFILVASNPHGFPAKCSLSGGVSHNRKAVTGTGSDPGN